MDTLRVFNNRSTWFVIAVLSLTYFHICRGSPVPSFCKNIAEEDKATYPECVVDDAGLPLSSAPANASSGNSTDAESAFANAEETKDEPTRQDEACPDEVKCVKLPDDQAMSGVLFEGDISGTMPDVEMLKKSSQNGLRDLNARWPGGVIPYVVSREFRQINPNTGKSYFQMIRDAMEGYHRLTCIRFVPRKRATDQSYIHIIAGTQCSSMIGRTKDVLGPQTVQLAIPGCMKNGIIQHELMHAAGFYHEQSRSDRNDYVVINQQNLRPDDFRANFQYYGNEAITAYG